MGDISEHFSRWEFKCPDCDFDVVDKELLQVLEWVRIRFGKRVTINSACRCEKHNKKVGGSPKSQHLFGKAADIVVEDVIPLEVYDFLATAYFDCYGIGNYPDFTHIDVRRARARW